MSISETTTGLQVTKAAWTPGDFSFIGKVCRLRRRVNSVRKVSDVPKDYVYANECVQRSPNKIMNQKTMVKALIEYIELFAFIYSFLHKLLKNINVLYKTFTNYVALLRSRCFF